MKRLPIFLYLGLLGSLLTFSGCDDDEGDISDGSTTVAVQTATDIPADADAPVGDPSQAPPPDYTFYSLTEGRVVDEADSNSTQWDIALAGTTILVNGGTSGPGQGEAQVMSGVFSDLLEAPEAGYQTDSESGLAVPGGSGNGWYNYTGGDTPSNAIIPIPGRVIVLRTAEGNYAKLEVVSYYEGNPDTTTPEFADNATRPAGRHYTFQYVMQPNGSRQF